MKFVSPRPRFLLLAMLAALGAGGCSTEPDAEPGIPPTLVRGAAEDFNVLFVTVDSARADRLGVYGNRKARTENLDRLARRGLRFGDAVTSAPLSLPAHASIFTGRYPPNHGVRHDRGYRLDPKQRTLAESLRDAGYRTAAFISSFRLDRRFGLNQGFDVYDDAVAGRRQSSELLERTAFEVTEKAAKWIRQRLDNPEPFFAWIHYNDPHAPYRAPERFARQFQGSPYDAELANVDFEIGRLLDALTVSGHRDRTLIVVTGDHGEALGDHAEQGHGLLLHESTLRIPLILSVPAIFDGPFLVDDTVVSVVDIFPTLVELLGLNAMPEIDGVSLLAADASESRGVYVEATSPYLDYGWSALSGLRYHRSKILFGGEPHRYDLNDEFVETEAKVGSIAPQEIELLDRLVGGESRMGEGQVADPMDKLEIVARIDQARRDQEQGRLEQALTLLREVESSSGSREVFDTLASVLDQLGRRDEALAMIEKSLDLSPSATMWVAKARLSIEDGRLDDAAAAIDSALEVESDYGAAYIARGDLAAARGDLDRARVDYFRAQNVDAYRAGSMAQERLAGLRRNEP